MTQSEFNHIVQSLDSLSLEQMQQLRHELDGRLGATEATKSVGQDLGSIGAMRDDAEFLDQVVADAMRDRREQPWRLAPSE